MRACPTSQSRPRTRGRQRTLLSAAPRIWGAGLAGRGLGVGADAAGLTGQALVACGGQVLSDEAGPHLDNHLRWTRTAGVAVCQCEDEQAREAVSERKQRGASPPSTAAGVLCIGRSVKGVGKPSSQAPFPW